MLGYVMKHDDSGTPLAMLKVSLGHHGPVTKYDRGWVRIRCFGHVHAVVRSY